MNDNPLKDCVVRAAFTYDPHVHGVEYARHEIQRRLRLAVADTITGRYTEQTVDAYGLKKIELEVYVMTPSQFHEAVRYYAQRYATRDPSTAILP